VEGYDSRQIVGIDLYRRRSVIVRMSQAGERLDAVRIDNDPVALGLEIAKAGEAPEVVLEATYGWHRAKLVALRSGLKAQVHAVLAKQGVTVAASDLFGVGGQQLLDQLVLDPPFTAPR